MYLCGMYVEWAKVDETVWLVAEATAVNILETVDLTKMEARSITESLFKSPKHLQPTIHTGLNDMDFTV